MNSSMNTPKILNDSSLEFVEGLYEDYLRDSNSVAADWQDYFSSIVDGDRTTKPQFHPSYQPASIFHPASGRTNGVSALSRPTDAAFQDRVYLLIRLYRVRGHRMAQLDPLGLPRPTPPELEPSFLGFTEADLDKTVHTETFPHDSDINLRELIARLRNTYCRSIGVQYMHIDDLGVRRWLQRRMESTQNRVQLTREEQLRILTRLTDAVTFEEFIRKKFTGAKSFSLEGSESLIPLLDLAIEKAADEGVEKIVFGMPHRGRLSVLANIMGKGARQIFREFADVDWKSQHGGDVKYHLGYRSDWTTAAGKKIHLSLCFNPSHLEWVNTVAQGRTRAKQERTNDAERSRNMTILMHGDAAFAGQGIVQETLNLSGLPGYTVGGTLHIIVNNQIGFTATPSEARTSVYATGIARMLQSPLFHVNGEDPEAVAQVVRLTMDFRREFKRDVFIDMYGYRRLGHNESDEPAFTQPVLYHAIEKRKSVREGYLEHLLTLNEVTRQEADEIAASRRDALEKELSASQTETARAEEPPSGIWAKYLGGPEASVEEVRTSVDKDKLVGLLEAQTRLPKDFNPHPKIKKILESRKKMASGEEPLDWSAAEALAFASLSVDGVPIRLTGQDSERGTFSHRHAVLHDFKDGHTYTPLQHLSADQGKIEIVNSPLSEAGVLGFEYGFSLDSPDALVLWEAQFGDFCNVAQPIFDQFIASAENKWQRLSGLVVLLPHGSEGQGPEHTSARLERFLSLAAEDNIQIVYPTTPSQYFHLLRRQVVRRWRKPLIVMTPKSLLRHPQCVSTLDELTKGRFQRFLPDTANLSPEQVKRILICSGKIYYELAAYRDEQKRTDVAIIRIEQLYPMQPEMLHRVLEKYSVGTPAFWVQEEPRNMGAWREMRVVFGEKLFDKYPLAGIARAPSPSPASGSAKRHKQEQSEIIKRAFGEK